MCSLLIVVTLPRSPAGCPGSGGTCCRVYADVRVDALEETRRQLRMPTVKIVTANGEHLVVADRVMRDSLFYAFERREAGSWVRVATVPRRVVTAVLRQVPGDGQTTWLAEDVRTSASLPAAAPSLPPATVTDVTLPDRRWRILTRRPSVTARS
jgi:hypothetical protein